MGYKAGEFLGAYTVKEQKIPDKAATRRSTTLGTPPPKWRSNRIDFSGPSQPNANNRADRRLGHYLSSFDVGILLYPAGGSI